MAVSILEFEKALKALDEAINVAQATKDESQFKIFRDACIQRFEFCIELAWKTSAKILGSSSTTAKPVIREMAQNGLINDPELWFTFIEARNKTSHSYDEKIAEDVYRTLLDFVPASKSLLEKIKIK